MTGISFVRTLRTLSSERFVVRREDSDIAALDIHYLANGTVQATLLVFDGMISESEVPRLLVFIDEVLLPDVSLDDKRLAFTVVIGRVLGAFEAVAESPVNES